MTPSRSSDLLLLLAGGLPVAACASAVADSGDSGSNQKAVDAAIDACAPYAVKVSNCYAASPSEYGYNYLTSLGYCIAYLGYADLTGVECRAALEDHFACLAQLDCEDLLDDVIDDDDDDATATLGDEPPPPPSPCDEEQAQVDELCVAED